ncbi:MAG: hypothetical protein KGI37_07565 [Alphaproteobacteria bacterium]|nr:hypothetical protein [Alphaproteobacteria bacterium]
MTHPHETDAGTPADMPLSELTHQIEQLTAQIDALQERRAAYAAEAESRLKKMKARKVRAS